MKSIYTDSKNNNKRTTTAIYIYQKFNIDMYIWNSLSLRMYIDYTQGHTHVTKTSIHLQINTKIIYLDIF